MKNSYLCALRSALSLVALCILGGASAATLVQKNVFPYDMYVSVGDSYFQKKVCYKLNGATSAVKIKIYCDGVLQKTVDGTIENPDAEGTYVNDIDLYALGIPSGKITWEVVATTATAATEPRFVTDKTSGFPGSQVDGCYRFFAPWGVTVNTCPESETFGRILVAESKYSTKTGVYATSKGTADTYHSSYYTTGKTSYGRGAACIYAFDPQMQPIANPNISGTVYGFNAGLSAPACTSNEVYNGSSTEYFHSISSIRYTADGRLFIGCSDPDFAPVYELNPNNLNQSAVAFFSGSSHGLGYVNAIDFCGEGENLKMIALHSANGMTTFSQSVFNIGTNTSWSAAPSASHGGVCTSTADNWAQKIALDRDGKGFVINRFQHEGSTEDNNYSQYRHHPINGTSIVAATANGLVITTIGANTCAVAYNRDGSLLARQEGVNIVKVYGCATANGVESLTLKYTINLNSLVTESGSWTNITDLAFDYADNLYAVTKTTERFACIQLPRSSKKTTVPIRSVYNINDFNAEMNIALSSVQFSEAGKSVTIDWSSSTNLDYATAYKVYARSNDEEVLVATLGKSARSYTYSIPVTDKYEFYVKAYHDDTLLASSPISTRTLYINNPTLSVQASRAASSTAVEISWTPDKIGAGATYTLTRNGTVIAENISETSFSDSFTAPDTYNYCVTASFDNEVVASCDCAPLTLNGANMALNVSYDSYNTQTVALDWGTDFDMGDASRLIVYRDGVEYAVFNNAATNLNIGNPSDDDDNPDTANSHTYYVKAVLGNDPDEANNLVLAVSNTVMIGFINPDFRITPENGETAYNENDLLRLDASVTWNRPISLYYTDAQTGGKYVLSHYNLQLTDPDSNPVDISGSDVTYSFNGNTYTAHVTDHDHDCVMEVDDPITATLVEAARMAAPSRAAEEYPSGEGESVEFKAVYPADDILFGEYTMTVTPVYVNAADDDDTTTVGAAASNSGEQSTSVFAPVTNLNVKTFRDSNNQVYRVDIYFTAPDTDMPVTYYEITTRPAGSSGEWTGLDHFFLIHGTDFLLYTKNSDDAGAPLAMPRRSAGTSDDDLNSALAEGKIIGSYDFDTDAGYVDDQGNKAVAFYYTTDDPAGQQYNVTAYYGATNTYLLSSEVTNAESSTTAPASNITTLISCPVADADCSATYYNLQGVAMPRGVKPAPGMYIERRGASSRKVFIK